MKKLIYLLLILYSTSLMAQDTIYIATNGNNDTGDGTIENPWGSLTFAVSKIDEPGDGIYIRGGRYMNNTIVKIDPENYNDPIGVNGTRENPIWIKGYPEDVLAGNKPIFDCRNHVNTYGYLQGKYNKFLEINHVEWWQFEDFDFSRVYQLDSVIDGGVSASFSRYLKFENIHMDSISQRGFYVRSGAWSSWYDYDQAHGEPNNVPEPYWDTPDDTCWFINCDISNLADSISNVGAGNGADAFKNDIYKGNVFIYDGCRMYYYCDDGMDLSNTNGGKFIINNCWAMASDKFKDAFPGWQTERNGFTKMNSIAANRGYTKENGNKCFTITNCISLYNVYGFATNAFLSSGNRIPNNSILYNNIAYKNSVRGFTDDDYLDTLNYTVYHNNIGYETGVSGGDFQHEGDAIIESHNNWDFNSEKQWGWEQSDSVTVTPDDFYYDITDSTLMDQMITAPRDVYGNLPPNPFRLKEGSDLIDKGIDVGFPYYGIAPDLGPSEFGTTSIIISQPSNLEDTLIIGENLAIKAIIKESVLTINKVDFVLEDKNLIIGQGAQKPETNLWEIEWNCDTAGSHILRALAINSANDTARSQMIRLTVLNNPLSLRPRSPSQLGKCSLSPTITNGFNLNLKLSERLPINSDIRVISIDGRIVANEKMDGHTDTKNNFESIPNLSPGIYFLKFVNDIDYNPCTTPLRIIKI